MSEFDFNLSTKPFPAYGVINLALIGILVVLILVTGWQVYGFVQYTALSNDIRAEEQRLRVDDEALAQRLAAAEAILDRPEATAKLSEIGFLNGLIVRKKFSWTRLFARLEDLVPDTVHLVNLSPQFQPDGSVLMRLNIRGRNHEEISRLIDTLEESPEFESVIVSTEQRQDASPSSDIDIAMTLNYYPDRDIAGNQQQ
jgi:hypothetical protein